MSGFHSAIAQGAFGDNDKLLGGQGGGEKKYVCKQWERMARGQLGFKVGQIPPPSPNETLDVKSFAHLCHYKPY